jgi:hypothetical protein
MVSTIERFRKDLERLVQRGKMLEYAMLVEVDHGSFVKQVKQQLKNKEKIDEFLKALPKFKKDYEEWYSEALALLRQLLPDRVANFIALYEKPKNRKSVTYGEYYIQDYLQGLQVTRVGSGVVVDSSAAIPQFRQQLAIVEAAGRRFDSSLFDIRQLVQADLLDSEVKAARELHKHGFNRAAGVIIGVVLEKHLLQVCEDRQIAVTKKNPGISDLNELLKANSVIDVPQWRHITLLGDIRNLCAHNKKKEPTAAQVEDLMDGADKVLKTIL